MYYAFIHKTLLSPFIRHTIETMMCDTEQQPCDMGFYCFVGEKQNTDLINKTPFYASMLMKADVVVELSGDSLIKHKYRYDLDTVLDMTRTTTPKIVFSALEDKVKDSIGETTQMDMMIAKLFLWHPSNIAMQVAAEKELADYGFDNFMQANEALNKSLVALDN